MFRIPSVPGLFPSLFSFAVSAILMKYFPAEVRSEFNKTVMSLFNSNVTVSFPEYSGGGPGGGIPYRNSAFAAIERYLNRISSDQSANLEAHLLRDSNNMMMTMSGSDIVTDEFEGVKVKWQCCHIIKKNEEKRILKLQFEKKDRRLVLEKYVDYAIKKGKSITALERKRKLYSNRSGGTAGQGRCLWNHVTFEHPATFDTLAMDSELKLEIIQDLETFSSSKDYYSQIGKAWKRGYLLHGPPGTGKSTLIAAIANFLNYDVYDLELTSVKDNAELRELVLGTSSKSVIVIEDIDCSLDITGKREEYESDSSSGDITLSGLLNSVDGLWSSCGSEKIFIFTTNFINKIDPALIRPGRMDKHIQMSYCNFASFKMLAKNYLDIDDHVLFDEIGRLLEQADVTPADVGEKLLPSYPGEGVDTRLRSLMRELRKRALQQNDVTAEEVSSLDYAH